MDYKRYGSISGYEEELIPLYPNLKKENKGNKVLGMTTSTYFFSIYFLLYIIFICSAAAMFSFLEAPEETALKVRLNAVIRNFLNSHPTVTDEALEELITEVVRASNRGVSAIRNATGEPNWSFGQSLFFSSTIVTTIGYGHVTPLSRMGKIFCIVFAVVGIPLTLVLLSALVERLLIPTIWLLQCLNSRLGHLYQPFNIRVLHLLLIVLILVIFFLLVPAALFASLGDYIPGDSADQPYRPIYKVATTCYLFLGITAMMLTLAVFYDIPQLNLGLLFTNEDASSEKVRLASAGLGLQYGAGTETSQDSSHRQVVRVRSRRTDSPSPEDSGPKSLRIP